MSQLPSVAENHCQRMEREECRSRKHNYYSNAMNQRQGKKRNLQQQLPLSRPKVLCVIVISGTMKRATFFNRASLKA